MSPTGPEPVRSSLFEVGDTPRLIASKCSDCGKHHFPRSSTCPYCSSDETEEALLSGTGVLWAWTAVTAAPPGYLGEVPFGFGVVELPEGIRVVSRLTESDPAALEEGEPMRLVVDKLHTDEERNEIVTYAFTPVSQP